jgi:hypothetical protein
VSVRVTNRPGQQLLGTNGRDDGPGVYRVPLLGHLAGSTAMYDVRDGPYMEMICTDVWQKGWWSIGIDNSALCTDPCNTSRLCHFLMVSNWPPSADYNLHSGRPKPVVTICI